MNIKKISLLCALLGAFVLIVVLLPPGMLSLDTLKIHQQTLLDRVEQAMNTIDAGMVRDGARYLFALRLMPLFPFFLVNLLMGLTRIQVRHYWWVSQLAMLPATVIYLNAGRELGKLTTLRDILSPGLLFAFTLLGLLPLVTRWLFSRYIPSIKK